MAGALPEPDGKCCKTMRKMISLGRIAKCASIMLLEFEDGFNTNLNYCPWCGQDFYAVK